MATVQTFVPALQLLLAESSWKLAGACGVAVGSVAVAELLNALTA
jgi:hypothetical protein